MLILYLTGIKPTFCNFPPPRADLQELTASTLHDEADEAITMHNRRPRESEKVMLRHPGADVLPYFCFSPRILEMSFRKTICIGFTHMSKTTLRYVTF
jgi:hypothetical protein